MALFIWHQLLDKPRRATPTDSQRGSLLGVAYSDDAIRAFLETTNSTYEYVGDDDVLCDRVADAILEDLLCSPCHGADLIFDGDAALCTECGLTFGMGNGIRSMFWPHDEFDDPADVTEKVKAFYEENPFPNYEEHDTLRSLIEKARRGGFARALDRAIPYNTTVPEVGCGTGQLTNFLGSSCRRVIGADICLNSLRLGEQFRREQDLARVRFVQMNLFRPCFKPNRFDVILCCGVLHHTADPLGGFRGLLPLLKPGGHIVVGLYNRYGRLLTDLRRQVFRLTGGRAKWIDPILRRKARSESQRRAWLADQYRNPHESKHTIGGILEWFDRTGVRFVHGIPSVTCRDAPLDRSDLFEPRPRPVRRRNPHGVDRKEARTDASRAAPIRRAAGPFLRPHWRACTLAGGLVARRDRLLGSCDTPDYTLLDRTFRATAPVPAMDGGGLPDRLDHHTRPAGRCLLRLDHTLGPVDAAVPLRSNGPPIGPVGRIALDTPKTHERC